MRYPERGLFKSGLEPASAVAYFLTFAHRLDNKEDKQKGNKSKHKAENQPSGGANEGR